MKKFLTALAALAVVATPVAAEARHRDSGHRSGDRVGSFLGGLLVGVVVGAAASSSERERQDDRYEPRYRDYEYDNYRPRRVCFEEQTVEYRYGRRYVYYEYRCR